MSYGDVMENTETAHREQPGDPLEVRKLEVEYRSRSGFGRTTETAYRFYVVRHTDETVVFEGNATTGDHHNPYAAAEARAFGFVHGYYTRDPQR
jgi:hypothetical protein